MKRIDTQLGKLVIKKSFSPKQLKAELRGLDLLCTIVHSTPVWSFLLESGKPFIISNDNGPTILIDVFASICNKICDGDPHITMYISQRPVCILRDCDIVDTPSTDSMVSLVLLGIAGWPIDSTPASLSKKSMTAKTTILIDISTLLESDHNQIDSALHIYREGYPHNALSLLSQIARRWYVCRFWSIEKIKQTLEPILEKLDEQDIAMYLRQPDEETDALFL